MRWQNRFGIFGLILLIGVVSLAFAEEKDEALIFKYKKELSITEVQEKNLRDLVAKFQNYLSTKMKELELHSDELNKMIKGEADLSLIKTKLQIIANIQAEANYEDIANVRTIQKVLTFEQMTKWRSMQEEFKKNAQKIQNVGQEPKGIAK
ncbi:MAG: hypothetical protein WCP39_07265 [Chlamydiota bacterium]